MNLKKFLIKRPELRLLLNQIIAGFEASIAILDSEGNLLLGSQSVCSGFCYPLEVNNQIIGSVYGDAAAHIVAAVMIYLVKAELEKKAILTETLSGYKELNLLYSIAEKLSSSLELKEVAKLVIDEAQRLLQARSGSVMLLDPQLDVLEIVAAFGFDTDVKLILKRGEGISGDVFQTGKAEIVNHVLSDPRFIRGQLSSGSAYALDWIRSLMCAPLKVKDQVIGVINLSSEFPDHFVASDLKLLMTLASQAALAINTSITHEIKLKKERICISLERLLGGRYKIIKDLGRGGFGQIFVAQDLQRPENPLCVVKQLRPIGQKLLSSARRLFQTEAETLERLGQHDQIPQLLAYFEQENEFYLAQEFIDGVPLSEELVEGYCMTEGQVKALLWDMLNILKFVHAHFVIHRDLKPNNIIRRKRDQKLVLIDFGTAKVLQAGILEGEDRTIEIGTPGYMPIEQIAGYPRFNSDLFALGIIGIQAITGLLPRQLERDLKTCELIWHGQVSSELAAILNRMVLYNFMERYQSAAEVLADLEQIFTQPGPQPLLA